MRTTQLRAEPRGQRKRHLRGTHRLVPPERTWARIAPLLPRVGITRVADVTGLDELGIPVFQAIRPEGHIVAVSQGKGLTADLARVSAAMEAVEGWHAERVRPAVVRGCEREVGPLPYALRDLALAPGSLVSDELVLDWIEATGLVSGRSVLVPRDYVTLSKLVRPGWAPPTFAASSNGLGSGNSLTEAALHGLCEVIESDCLTRATELPPDRRPRVDPDTVDDPDCRRLLALLAAKGNAVEIFDVSTELAVPCYMATIVSELLPRRFSGAGCHPDAGVALARALTEAAQVRLVVIAAARDDLADVVYTEHQPRLSVRGRDVTGDVPFGRTASVAGDTLAGDLSLLARRVQRWIGVEPLLVDLSHDSIGVPVAMVLAPGLVCQLEQLGFREASA